jgi:hypothetical protein
MKSVSEDGGECWEKWYRTRKTHLLRLSGPPPKSLCRDELNLTQCSRYTERLLKNPRILRYLMKYHPAEVLQLQTLLREFELTCQTSI